MVSPRIVSACNPSVLFGLWLLSLCGGCGRQPPKPVVIPGRPNEPAWHDDHDMPWEIDPADISFSELIVRQQLLRADQEARSMQAVRWKAADWIEHPSAKYAYLHWNSGSFSGYNRRYAGIWESPTLTVAVSTVLCDEPRLAYEFKLESRKSSQTGWSVVVEYRCGRYPDNAFEWFELRFNHPDLMPMPDRRDWLRGIRLGANGPNMEFEVRDDIYHCKFAFTNGIFDSTNGFVYRLDPDDIAKYWMSAESFRTAALDELERFESKTLEEIASSNVRYDLRLQGTSRNGLPLERVIGEEIPAGIQIQAAQKVSGGVALQRQLVEDHFQELHHVATTAFPGLVDVVSEGRE